MAITISFVNMKGGVAKTTSVASVGCILAHMGYRVLMIDLDVQANLTTAFLPEGRQRSFVHILKGDNSVRGVEIEPNLSLLPSDIEMSGAESALLAWTGDKRYKILSVMLQNKRRQLDFILIDCPPSVGLVTANALVASDMYLCPCRLEDDSLRGVITLKKLINSVVRDVNPELKFGGVFFTMYDLRSRLAISVKNAFDDKFGDHILDSKIRRNVAVAEAKRNHMGVDVYAPDSNAAKDYAALVAEVLSKLKIA